jgi:hypothetical protein
MKEPGRVVRMLNLVNIITVTFGLCEPGRLEQEQGPGAIPL